MKRKSCLAVIALLTAFGMAGCSENHSADYSIQTPETSLYAYGENMYGNGMLYTIMNTAEQAYFLDYSTMQGIPLCNMPNCTHQSSCVSNQCTSSLVQVVYQDNLYYFDGSWEIVDAEDGMSQSVEVKCQCKRADLTTGEIEVIAELEGVDMSHATEAVLDGNMLYIIGSYSAYQSPDGTWAYTGSGGKQYLYSIDLNSGETTDYGLVNDSPYAGNNRVVDGNSTHTLYDTVTIDGVYDGKIYMHYQYVEDQQELINFLHNNGDVLVAIHTEVPWMFENKCFDLEEKTLNKSELPYAQDIAEETYIYRENGTYTILTEDGDTIAAGMERANADSMTYVNGKLWELNVANCGFDAATGETLEIADRYLNCGARVMDYVNNQYIVQYFGESGMMFDLVSEVNLLKTN
ncbi:MAG: hypothetical protein IJ265_03545 [Oscillospiraceae bacterium]|nr:hypothetical protein [Oscillospiraceae bacterium]